jgi:hypothetical protein
VVVTESFEVLARNEGVAYGMPDVRTVQVPHPLAGVDDATRRKMAAQAADGIERLFNSPTKG